MTFTQSVLAESTFPEGDLRIPEEAGAMYSDREIFDKNNTFSDPKIIKSVNNNFVDKWELNKMCLGKFCLDDPITKHGGFKAFKLENPNIKPKLLGCNKSSISLISLKPLIEQKIYVTPSHEYQKKGVDNYYRITSIESSFPEISQENIN